MRRYLSLLLLLLLAGCNGGSSELSANGPDNAPVDTGQTPPIELALTAQPDGANQRVILSAPAAEDLYQIASTLVYDPARYEVLSVEAGGGLGMPDDSFFVSGEVQQGRIDFAYTKRFAGAGASGDVSLVHLVVRPLDSFRLTDFSLDTAEGKTLVRDSRKRNVDASCRQEVQQ